mmetsp:Transcript_25221/g.25434  ORF Transcript_25221/g.25434 Transcript_25221/m.25434 type:complete len:169 (+) Transcript_25221:121-627(+)|eukprot:CAMPEP_0182418718 /NCGR_PEP_ID=MMETSP1167-20130531/3088_1 /TAXON_ID=2988 /ORGANISM="Mallomonas Sp, Strain CCMP3275" /LENGTH=168 /DNA_ID=CAMNT_0024593051 /DNA_START=14 /DNA_END=523 /DNA_ORIENTATION=+
MNHFNESNRLDSLRSGFVKSVDSMLAVAHESASQEKSLAHRCFEDIDGNLEGYLDDELPILLDALKAKLESKFEDYVENSELNKTFDALDAASADDPLLIALTNAKILQIDAYKLANMQLETDIKELHMKRQKKISDMNFQLTQLNNFQELIAQARAICTADDGTEET